jgi:hypothetical protein
LLTGLALVGFPILNFIYWPLVLRSGVLPGDGDSIAIPMFSSVLAALVLSPVVLGIARVCLRRYNPGPRLRAWRTDRPYRSAACTLLFGAGAAFMVAGVLDNLTPDLPWYEYLWRPYLSLWVACLLGLRAAAIEQLS